MALDRLTLVALAAIFAMLAAAYSPWWMAGAAAVAGIWGFDRWARHGRVASIRGPRGRPLPLADATNARHPRYVIGDFMAACCDARPGALLVRVADLDKIIRQCAHECRRVGQPEPPMVLVLNALDPYCGGCALPYSAALLRQKWRDATCKGGVEVALGALPTGEGRCPKCGAETVMLVFEV